jgi:integrase
MRYAQEFLSHKAVKTQKEYGYALGDWEGFCSKRGDDPWCPADPTAAAYRTYLEDNGNSSATVCARLRALKSYFTFLAETGRRQGANPFNRYSCPAPRQDAERVRETVYLHHVTLDKIFRELKDNTKPKGKMWHCLFTLMYSCALRRGEVVKLTPDDFAYEPKTGALKMRLRDTKAGVEQEMTVPRWAVEIVLPWIRGRVHYPKVFDVGAEGVAAKFKRLLPADMQDVGTHSLRATAITNFLKASGYDLEMARRFSRHASIEMLKRYDKRSDEAVGDFQEKLEPEGGK